MRKTEILDRLHRQLNNVLANRMIWRKKLEILLYEERTSLYLWGFGTLGHAILHRLLTLDARPCAIIDSSPDIQGKNILGIPCVPPETLKKTKNPIVIIGTGKYSREVAEKLKSMNIHRILDASDFSCNRIFDGMENEDIVKIVERASISFDLLADEKSQMVFIKKLMGFLNFTPDFGKQNYYHEIWEDNQYFLTDLIHFAPQEVLVDCGAYTGDTMQDFLQRKLPFQKYIAYELSRKNYDILCSEMTKVPYDEAFTLTAYNYGVGERAEKVFYNDNTTGTHITRQGECGEIVRLSDHLAGEHVSFIKMDIEGSECAALKGSAELIRREHPKLAICVYHRLQDLWEIPLLIHTLEPRYKFYLRHHTPVWFETVLYAIPI